MEWFGHTETLQKGHADLVTQADFASQDLIRRIVFEAFPDHAFLGEETLPGAAGRHTADAGGGQGGYRWIVDPLDGTTNYVHGVPHFSVSLALERSGELVVGCVFNPISGECYKAIAGEGAWLDDRPIRTSECEDLSEALAVTGFPPLVTLDAPDVKLFLAGLNACQAIRRTGSAALNMCYLAAGRFDVNWSFSTKIWDVAAGALLIREAGGVIVAPNGGPFDMRSGRFLAAANRPLLDRLLDLAAEAGL